MSSGSVNRTTSTKSDFWQTSIICFLHWFYTVLSIQILKLQCVMLFKGNWSNPSNPQPRLLIPCENRPTCSFKGSSFEPRYVRSDSELTRKFQIPQRSRLSQNHGTHLWSRRKELEPEFIPLFWWRIGEWESVRSGNISNRIHACYSRHFNSFFHHSNMAILMPDYKEINRAFSKDLGTGQRPQNSNLSYDLGNWKTERWKAPKGPAFGGLFGML